MIARDWGRGKVCWARGIRRLWAQWGNRERHTSAFLRHCELVILDLKMAETNGSESYTPAVPHELNQNPDRVLFAYVHFGLHPYTR